MSALFDKNHDGKVDLKDLKGQQTYANQPNAHRNPLDRNGDGRVDLKDLTAQNALNPGMMQTTTQTTTLTSLPLTSGLDRNHDGIDDRLQGGRRLSNGQLIGLDRNHDGIDDRLQTGLVGGIDRNHDGIDDRLQGRRLSRGYDATLLNQGTYIQTEQRASLVRAEPTIMETIQKDVVVHERIHPMQKEEIQPIIYREREQLDVKQVTQLLHETQIQPTILEQRNLEAQYREAVVERGAPIQPNVVLPSSQREATTRTQIIHAPIVEEVIKKRVIEEVQPVLERDVIQATVIQNTQPIYEKIIEAPTITREILQVRELGTVNGSSYSSDMSMGQRRLSQTYTTGVLPMQQNQFQSAPLQGQRLSGNHNENILLNQQNQFQSAPLQGQRLSGNLSDNYLLQQQNQRLSGSYVDPMLLQQSQGQYAVAGPAQMQSRRLSQTYANGVLPLQNQMGLQGMQSTQPLLPGLNNTAIGTAHMVPTNATMQGYGQSTLMGNGIQNGNVRYANTNSNSAYGLQGSDAYLKTVEMERLRDLQAAQITPSSLNRM